MKTTLFREFDVPCARFGKYLPKQKQYPARKERAAKITQENKKEMWHRKNQELPAYTGHLNGLQMLYCCISRT